MRPAVTRVCKPKLLEVPPPSASAAPVQPGWRLGNVHLLTPSFVDQHMGQPTVTSNETKSQVTRAF